MTFDPETAAWAASVAAADEAVDDWLDAIELVLDTSGGSPYWTADDVISAHEGLEAETDALFSDTPLAQLVIALARRENRS